MGVDDALASLVPAGEPTGNRQDDLAFVHRRHLQIILELRVDPLVGTNEQNFGLLLFDDVT